MPNRTIVTRLTANVSGYTAGMARASASTAAFAAEARGAGAAASTGLTGAGTAAQRAGGRFASLEHGAGAAGVSLRTLGLGGAVIVAVGLGAAVKAAAEFDNKMAAVKANVDLGGVSFNKLTDAVKTQGTQFGFTASQSADAADDLAKAGLNASQIIGGGLTGALTLAAAGNISTGEAAETAATAMTMFGKSAKDIPHIADLLAAGADKSTASVHSLAEGLMEGGSLAHLMGVSIEDTTAVMAEFDQSGLKGAKAGNALKTMFQNMLAPTQKQQETMDKLNLSFFDANGKFIGLAGTAKELKSKLSGLTDQQRNAALSILFGARSIQAANILYKDGAKGVQDWEQKTNAAGFAAENAAKKQDSLVGDLNKTKAAAQNAAIELGNRLTPALRGAAKMATTALQGTTKLVGGLANVGSAAGSATLGHLPSSMQSAAVAMGVAAAASKLLGSRMDTANQRLSAFGQRGLSGIRTFTSTIREASTATGTMIRVGSQGEAAMGRFGSAIERIGRSSSTVARMQGAFMTAASGAARLPRVLGTAAAAATGLRAAGGGLMAAMGGPWGLAIAGGVLGLSLWQKHQQSAAEKVAEHQQRVEELTQAIQKDGNELGKASAAQIAKNIVDSDTLDIANKMGISQAKLTQAWMGQPAAMKSVNETLDDYKSKALQTRTAQGTLTAGAKEQIANIEKVRSGMQDQVKDTGDVISKNKEYAKSQKIAADALNGSYTAIGSYNLEQAKLTAATKNSTAANKELNDALDHLNNTFLGLRGSARDYEAAIDDATAAAKKNGKTLDEHSAKGRANAAAMDKVASSGLEMIAAMRKNGASNAQLATSMGTLKSQLYKTAAQFGLTGKAADDYVKGALGKIPKEIKTAVEADTAKAQASLKATRAAARDLGVDFDKLPKKVQMQLVTKGMKTGKVDMKDLKTAVEEMPKELRLPTSVPGADGAKLKLNQLTVTAVTADGKVVQIPCSTPGQAKALHDILALHGAQISADGKQVIIKSDAPLAAATKKKIDDIKGAQVSTNGRVVTINTSAPGAIAAYNEIMAASRAATAVNGQYSKITIDTIHRHITEQLSRYPGPAADGALFGSNGVKRMASGGVVQREAMMANRPILWAEAGPEAYIPLGANKRNARTDKLFRTTADILGYDVIRRARRAADGYMSDWSRAVPAVSSPTVIVQGGTGGGLTNADRALLRQSMQVSQKVLAAMPGAVESGLAGRRSKDAQSGHLARRAGGGY